VHIVKGEYPVREGLILGHEPIGVIDELGEGLEDEYTVGQRVIVGAIPSVVPGPPAVGDPRRRRDPHGILKGL
jgi:threonine dehydrogenase-like Zn-dependent dehydrogenase